MYNDFFGFKESPFNITPDPKFLYLSTTHHEAISHLKYGLNEKKGFIVITGEVGCGKTTLCRALLNQLDPQSYQTALILNSKVNERQLLRDIYRELGGLLTLNEEDLVNKINGLLLKKISEGKNVVVIIDEAQNLSTEVLEQVRLLSNLETDTQKLFQIVLIGQPELKDLLNKKELRQLKQRILVHYDLKPLTFQETSRYVQHRLSITQTNKQPIYFTYWALRKLHKHSKGIPRIINNLCDKSLLSAFVKSSNVIDYFDVRRAVKECTILL